MKTLLVWTQRPHGRAAYRMFLRALHAGHTFEAHDWMQVQADRGTFKAELQMAIDVLEYQAVMACDPQAEAALGELAIEVPVVTEASLRA